jgi:hypothetical protein
MAIAPDRSGNNPGNPALNGWTGVDPHNPTLTELERDFYGATDTSSTFTKTLLPLTTAALWRTSLGLGDASLITSGVLDPARIPVLFTGIQIVSSGGIAALTAPQQAQISAGAVVTTTDGRRWIYASGSKVLEASYIELADVTPDWSIIANKPAAASTVQALANALTGTVGVSTSYAPEDHAHAYPGATINAQAGTTYTLVASDHGKVIELNNAGAITLTLPNSLGVGFNCSICQLGAGQVTIAAASGATIRQRYSFTKTNGQYSEVSIRVRGNAGGSSAEYVVSGDMA